VLKLLIVKAQKIKVKFTFGHVIKKYSIGRVDGQFYSFLTFALYM